MSIIDDDIMQSALTLRKQPEDLQKLKWKEDVERRQYMFYMLCIAFGLGLTIYSILR